jgi:hypothetical protein
MCDEMVALELLMEASVTHVHMMCSGELKKSVMQDYVQGEKRRHDVKEILVTGCSVTLVTLTALAIRDKHSLVSNYKVA